MKNTASFFLFSLLLCNATLLIAQIKTETVALESDKFQDYFYEALKQKTIENNDLAIVALEKCLALKPNDATLLSEMGKNYFSLKNYEKSFSFYENAAKIEPQNKWYWIGMLAASSKTKNYSQAQIAIKKLIEFDDSYNEDLVSLYMNTQQFDEALVLINELNEKNGKSELRESFKRKILAKGKFQNNEIEYLQSQIKLNPQLEASYISLFKRYSDNNEIQKATDILKKIEKEIPNSVWVQLSFFRNFLSKNEGLKAINSMNLILASTQIDSIIKHKIFKEFLLFATKNRQYSNDVEHAVTYFDNDIATEINQEIGKFFHTNKQFDKALFYLEKTLKTNQNISIETYKLVIKVYIENNQFANAVTITKAALEYFPIEPELYYFSGYANIQLKEYKKAITLLETGIDFVVNNVQLEIDFNLKLSEAYKALGNVTKSELYALKSIQLVKTKNKQ